VSALDSIKRRVSPFWVLQIGGWAAYGLLIVITLVPTLHPGVPLSRLVWSKLARTLIGFTLSLGVRVVYKRLRARNAPAGVLGAAAVACSVAFGAVWAALYKSYGWIVTAPPVSLVEHLQNWPAFGRDVLDYAYVLFAWSTSYFGIKYWQDLQAERERALRASALAHQAQLEMLRYQLNPHFLFNALNSIRASIDEDRSRAKGMITELSEFLRYSLVSAQRTGVPLREEIEAVKNYLTIERIRFEEKLEVELDIAPEAEGVLVPSFIVHPLVENAIKHGMRNGGAPLRVRLVARVENGCLRLEVANTGHLADEPAKARESTGIGLKNIRRRLDAVFAGHGSFAIFEQDGWIRAVIEIPR
jgi:two-component system LytT family sensor kinase